MFETHEFKSDVFVTADTLIVLECDDFPEWEFRRFVRPESMTHYHSNQTYQMTFKVTGPEIKIVISSLPISHETIAEVKYWQSVPFPWEVV